MMQRQYGVLLPHFGSHASRDRLIEGARQIEAYGFDSVWVRDHVVYHPHPHEDQDRTHLDPFVVLSAVAAATEKLILAMGVLIPHRHPVHSALLFGSLDFIAGPGRVEAGVGIGNFDHEFEAVGVPLWDRRELIEEHVAIWRKLWEGVPVDHRSEHYEFTGVDVHPTPSGGDLPVWYGGNSPAAVRRAVEYCQGWIPGRIPRSLYVSRMDRMRRLAEEAGKPTPRAGSIPYVSPGRTVEEASRHLDLSHLLKEVNGLFPKSGPFESVSDLGGLAIAGPPDRIIEEIRLDQAAGVEHFVFDFRTRFADWEEVLAMAGEEILPELRRGDT